MAVKSRDLKSVLVSSLQIAHGNGSGIEKFSKKCFYFIIHNIKKWYCCDVSVFVVILKFLEKKKHKQKNLHSGNSVNKKNEH